MKNQKDPKFISKAFSGRNLRPDGKRIGDDELEELWKIFALAIAVIVQCSANQPKLDNEETAVTIKVKQPDKNTSKRSGKRWVI